MHPDDPDGLAADEAAATVEGGPFQPPFEEAMTQENFDALMEKYLSEFKRLQKLNKSRRVSLIEEFGPQAQLSSADVARIRIEAFIDFMVPPGSPERLVFEGQHEQRLADNLEAFRNQILKDLQEAAKPKLFRPDQARAMGGLPNLRGG